MIEFLFTALLNYSITLHLNLLTFLFFTSSVCWLIFYILRYYVFTKYNRLAQPTPTQEPPAIPHTQDSPQKDTKHYLPEEIFANFLQENKVFSYLEKQVLTEFAKNSQQKKLYKDEILWQYDDSNRDLHLVMNGTMQVYLSGHEDGDVLVSEVTSGGIVSSLFDILAIYTELLVEEEAQVSTESTSVEDTYAVPQVATISSEPISPESSASQQVNQPREDELKSPEQILQQHVLPPSALKNVVKIIQESPLLKPHISGFSTQSLLYAKSSQETTLLVIPESTFRRIAHYYPSSAAHLVQIILLKFTRVTAMTINKYLGLTSEMFKIEKSVNQQFCAATKGEVPLDNKEIERLKKLPRKFNRGSLTPGSTKKFWNSKRISVDESMSLSESKTMKSLSELASFISSQKDEEKSSKNKPILEESLNTSLSESKTLKSISELAGFIATQREQEDKAKNNNKPPHHQRSLSSHIDLSTVCLAGVEVGESEKEIREKVYEHLAKGLGVYATLTEAGTMVSLTHTPKVSTPVAGRSSIPLGKKTSLDFMSSPVASTVSSINVLPHDFQNDLHILFYSEGSTVITQGHRVPGLYFLIDGEFEVTTIDQNYSIRKGALNSKHLMTVQPGSVFGYLFSFSNHRSFVSVKASKDSLVAFFHKKTMEMMGEKHPSVLFTLAKRLVSNISPLVVHLDLALEWIQVTAGNVLYEQGDKSSDSIYIVLNGRLRSVEANHDKINVLGEYGQGESVGELEVLTDSPRISTVHAIRDTEMACMPKSLFNALAMKHPEITIHISRVIAGRARVSQIQKNSAGNFNWRTIALIPENSEVPLLDFAERLKEAIGLVEEGSSVVLDSTTVTGVLGKYAFSRLGKLKLSSWLGDVEEKSRIVLYVADSGANAPWTHRCIRQADMILFVAMGDSIANVGEYEKSMLKMKTTARKELVLLHSEHFVKNGMTRRWRNTRSWIQDHHHIQIPYLITRSFSVAKQKSPFEDLKQHLEKITGLAFFSYRFISSKKTSFTPKHAESKSDFARLARRLTGKSIGLALGGGGARGIAHIGIIQAFEEAGVPVDLVGGVSIGAMIGGLYSINEDVWFVYWKAKEFAYKAGSMWRQLLDLTYPLTSWFSGQEFNRAIWKCFGENTIEDCWLNYFCLTTNISHCRLETHTMGYMWRYIRASMSLSGFLPPLCDNGDMLVDGGYLNNLPGDIIRMKGADTVIAVDVSSDEVTVPVTYGDHLSGWYALLVRSNPFSRSTYIPSLADIQSRLTYVSCYSQLEVVKQMDGCIYLRPPVGKFGTMDFNRFDEIYEVGYKYGQQILKEWEVQGTLRQFVVEPIGQQKLHTRRNSF